MNNELLNSQIDNFIASLENDVLNVIYDQETISAHALDYIREINIWVMVRVDYPEVTYMMFNGQHSLTTGDRDEIIFEIACQFEKVGA